MELENTAAFLGVWLSFFVCLLEADVATSQVALSVWFLNVLIFIPHLSAESLPQVFFPSVVAVNKETGQKVVGKEAYHPDVRKNSTLLHPIRPSNKVDQVRTRSVA